MSGFRFASPIALLLLTLLPGVAILARRRLTPRPAVAMRGVAIALLIFSLAAPQIAGVGGGQTVVFAVDLSDSIPAEARDAAMHFVRAAAGYRQPGDRVGIVTFGNDAVIEEAPSTDPRLDFTSHPAPDVTDLEQAVRTALLALPSSGARRIVILTDGNANRGNLNEALALARSQDVEVSVVPLVPGRDAEVLVDEVTALPEVRVGERFTVRVVIAATTKAEVHLRVVENETLIDQRTMTVQPGRMVITIPRVARREGMLQYTASIVAVPDGATANNRASALVAVRGTPLVWYVAREPGPLAQSLIRQGMRVQVLAPEALPASAAEYRGTAAVVLDDISATLLSAAQMAALRDFVGQLGGGLLAVGGPHSFGVGGYAGTPLEEVLPVSMDVRHRLVIPSMAIILVIDASGSMGAFGQEVAKVELAKETAQSVIDLIGERDIIGVIAFDQEPRWLARPTEARLRQQVMDQVSRLQAGGGTNMYPAIRLAYDYLRDSRAKVRHVIVLSDGQTDPGDFRGLLTQMSKEKITVSSVAIGSDADVEIMQNVARWGGGRYYFARDLYTIPQILTAEALLASRAYVVEERFTPQLARSDLLGDLKPPALRGYIATAPKPAGAVHLVSQQDDPILAAWQYGIGRAIAFTSDATSRWAAEWMTWPDLARFWSRLARWVSREDAGELAVTIDRQDSSIAVVADAHTLQGDSVDGLQAQARVVSPALRAAIPMVQTAPGRYEARVDASTPGTYAVTVAARDASGRVRARTTGFVIPYSPELRDLTVNRGVLEQIAEATGGRVLDNPRAAMAPMRTAQQTTDAWPIFAGAAVGLFVLEIAFRRLPVVGYHLAMIAGTVLAWVRRQPSLREIEDDRRYAEADRWKFVEPESTAASESMEQAARLYIARLKSTKQDDEEKRE